MSQVQAANEAIRRGDKATAIRLLADVLQTDPRNEEAWLGLAEAIDDPAKKQECLQRARAIRESKKKPEPMTPALTTAHATTRQKVCGWCKSTIPQDALVCPHCGRSQSKAQAVAQLVTRAGCLLIILGLSIPICIIVYAAIFGGK